MKKVARKILLPTLMLTEVANESDDGAVCVTIPSNQNLPSKTYYIRPQRVVGENKYRGINPSWVNYRFNLFPVVLDNKGVPWAEANIYLLSRLKDDLTPTMSSYASIASDLAAYRNFLDDSNTIDWTKFPSEKWDRPTYRYNAYLKQAVTLGEIKTTTAKRRMSSIISFYRRLSQKMILIPENDPWKESDRYVEIKSAYGAKSFKSVTTTDISIKVFKQKDPYAGTITDGGELRPLNQEEQDWVIEALEAQSNIEMTLIHIMGLSTGARIQTILTLKLGHFLTELPPDLQEHRLAIGPGQGVDTKNNKLMSLHIPNWLYHMLRTYAFSTRARKRRERANGGDTENQYFFLSVRGAPYYQSKEDAHIFDETNKLHHAKTGQGVRQFIVERIIPFIREKHNAKFQYKFHDTRATFGMNLTDYMLARVQRGEINLSQARDFVRVRMGHESSATTDIYLKYRENSSTSRNVRENWSSHLQKLSESALKFRNE